jgi:histidine triad (HIT) family protein
MAPDGLNIIQSNGDAASQTVMHLHVHIVPRWRDDPMGSIWPEKTHYSEAQKDTAWHRIQSQADQISADSGLNAERDGSSFMPKSDPEDRRKHLDYIQAVVTRMSASSTTSKGWLLPIITAAYGYAVVNRSVGVAGLGMLAAALFGLIDAHYLNQERAFRRLYDAVAYGDKVKRFSLDPSLAAPALPASPSRRNNMDSRAWQIVQRWIPDRDVWLSWAIAPFYGALLLAGVVIVCLYA